jgi:hypothetical protein
MSAHNWCIRYMAAHTHAHMHMYTVRECTMSGAGVASGPSLPHANVSQFWLYLQENWEGSCTHPHLGPGRNGGSEVPALSYIQLQHKCCKWPTQVACES